MLNGWREQHYPAARRIRLSYREMPEGPEQELPFIIGFVGDFAGDAEALPYPNFLNIDGRDVDHAMAVLRPRRVLPSCVLDFTCLADFEPDAILRRVPVFTAGLTERALVAALRHGWREKERQEKDWLAGIARDAAMMLRGTATGAGPPDAHTENLQALVASAMAAVDPMLWLDCRLAAIDADLAAGLARLQAEPGLRALEASWRGLARLAARLDGADVQLAVLSLSEARLRRDLDIGLELRRKPGADERQRLLSTLLHRRLNAIAYYNGKPFGLICLDMALGGSQRDLILMRTLALLGDSVQTPIIAAAAPRLLGLQDFAEAGTGADLATRAAALRTDSDWAGLRGLWESQFLALLLPGLLLPPTRKAAFGRPATLPRQHLAPAAPLWLNPIYAFAEIVGQAFTRDGWPVALTGLAHGKVELPAAQGFGTGEGDRAVPPSLPFVAIGAVEDALADAGLLPLVHCQGRGHAAFFHANSLYRPSQDDEDRPNALMRARLPLIFAISRISHYLKIISRQNIGQVATAPAIEHRLNQWLSRYVAHQDDAAPEIRLRQPLRRGHVRVFPHPDRDDLFEMQVEIQPHFQFDELDCAISLTTDLDRSNTMPLGSGQTETAHGA